jgi:HK97 gp10 family phage protein
MVKGVAELQKKLTVVFPALVEQRVKEALEKAANQVVAQMKSRAPVYSGPPEIRSDKRHKGEPVIPGALRDSIAWTWGDAPKGTVSLGSVQTGLTKEGTTKLTIYAGDRKAFYARWVEFGTRKWKGNPFFFSTWRNNKRKVKGQLTRAIRKAIKEMGMV